RFEQQELGLESPRRTDLHLGRSVQMLPSGSHFITRLGNADDNLAVWRQLLPLRGANQFAKLQNRATVLARADDPRSGEPLLVGWTFGSGRVLAFAGDTTNLWWRHGYQTQHKRFWRQAMLWLAQKDAAQSQDVWIQLEKRRFLPGEPIRFTAGARGVDGEPMERAQLKAELKFPTGEKQPIQISPNEDVWEGTWDEVLEHGEYELQVSATFEGKEVGSSAGRFVVVQRDLELTDPTANPERMRMLASLTKEAGGKDVRPEQFNDLLQEISGSPPESHIEIQSKSQLGDAGIVTWVFVCLFVSVASVEWFLRKRWGMV
ncbi:MAG: hypothetical protein KDB27_36125, partial [Planctomycetales bacterium]|nr:hypothetical protein [Planctomycetales bacterium]